MQEYKQLEEGSLGSLVSNVPKFNGTTVSFFDSSSFIYMLLFSAIIGAAFYEYILVGVYRMEASESGIRKSNETFKRTTLGLLGVFALFLIIFTLNKGLLTGDVGLTSIKSAPVPATTPSSNTNTPTNNGAVAPPAAPAGSPAGSGILASRIYSSALSLKNTLSTANAPGTSGGRLACAYAVNEVLKNAGIAPIDRLGNLSVRSMESGLQAGRGTLINQASTVQGDIVIEAGTAHVGVCLNNGCSQVISNSSSKASFSWVSGPDFRDSYKQGVGRFYRVNN